MNDLELAIALLVQAAKGWREEETLSIRSAAELRPVARTFAAREDYRAEIARAKAQVLEQAINDLRDPDVLARLAEERTVSR